MTSAARDEKVVSSVCNNSEIAAAAVDTITKNSQCKEDSSLAGLPDIPCIFCRSYQTPIEFDLALHLQEYHRMDLVTNLSMEKGYHSIEERADYAVELGKKGRRS